MKAKTKEGHTPLHYATLYSDVSVVSITYNNNERERERESVCVYMCLIPREVLVDGGALVNEEDPESMTPLVNAILEVPH